MVRYRQPGKGGRVLTAGLVAMIIGGCSVPGAATTQMSPMADPQVIRSPTEATPAPIAVDRAALAAETDRRLREASGLECVGGTDYLRDFGPDLYRKMQQDDNVSQGWNDTKSVWFGELSDLSNDSATEFVGTAEDRAWIIFERDGHLLGGEYVAIPDPELGTTYWVQASVRGAMRCG